MKVYLVGLGMLSWTWCLKTCTVVGLLEQKKKHYCLSLLCFSHQNLQTCETWNNFGDILEAGIDESHQDLKKPFSALAAVYSIHTCWYCRCRDMLVFENTHKYNITHWLIFNPLKFQSFLSKVKVFNILSICANVCTWTTGSA